MRKKGKRAITKLVCIALLLSTVTSCAKKQTLAFPKDDTKQVTDHYRTYYEIFVASFFDSDKDGTGDINGIIQKLDYLNDADASTETDLGITGIWLMPIMPSNTYHKYDVDDFCAVDEEYGTVDEFKTMVEKCHERNINVIIDFPFNHTSDTHPWFKETISYYQSLKDGQLPQEKECPYAFYYNVTKDNKGNPKYYRIPGTDWYYEGAFWSEMPDLNLDNPLVRKEILAAADFWIDLGVDGFRLDAAKEYFSGNNKKNKEVLSWFSNEMDQRDGNLYCVAEVWDTFGTIASYYESGIESIFNYAVGNSQGLYANAVRSMKTSKQGKKFAENLKTIQDIFWSRNADCVDAPFISNHDNDRFAGYVNEDTNKIKLMAGMNLMMTGCSFIYYGEEIGMTGGGADENKRKPMLWDREEEQTDQPDSILNYYRHAIRIRNCYPEISHGVIEVVEKLPLEIAGVKKTYEEESCYVLMNISETQVSISLKEAELTDLNMEQVLTVSKEQPEVNQSTLTIPAYGIVILK